MTKSIKFDTEKLAKLNNPNRLKSLNPELIWKNLALPQSEVVIDIGAGTGFFASLFASEMKAGTIYACDTSDVMIDYMNENLASDNDCKIIPLKSEENKIPLQDNIADLVYLINVYHELEEAGKLLAEASRLLKNGGTLAIIDWKHEDTQDGPPLSRRIPAKNIITELNKNNYKNIKTLDILPFHYFIISNK